MSIFSVGNSQECPVLPNPSNGRVKYSRGRRVGASIWYVCDSGYTLIGSESRTCLRNLSWSNEAPACKRTWNHSQWKGEGDMTNSYSLQEELKNVLFFPTQAMDASSTPEEGVLVPVSGMSVTQATL